MEQPKYNEQHNREVELMREGSPFEVIDRVDYRIVRVAGVPLKTEVPEGELKEILDSINPSPAAVEILQNMIVSHQQGRGLIIEGETAIGKTYLVEKFTQLVFGKDRKPVDFYCNQQTDASAFLAKYVPNTGDAEDTEKYQKFFADNPERFTSILNNPENRDPEKLSQALLQLATDAGLRISPQANWKFQYGALPRAMTMPVNPNEPISETNPSVGTILHIQEAGFAYAGVLAALFQLAGHGGKITSSIQLWEDSGREVEVGENFWVVMSTNPPDGGYIDRQGLDPALLRRFNYLAGVDNPKATQIATHIRARLPVPKTLYTKHTKYRPLEINEQVPEWWGIEVIRKLFVEVYLEFVEQIKSQMENKDLTRRKQQMELTDDDMRTVFDIIETYSSSDPLALMDFAIEIAYANRFSNTQEYSQGVSHRQQVINIWKTIKEAKNLQERLDELLPKEEDDLRGEHTKFFSERIGAEGESPIVSEMLKEYEANGCKIPQENS